jgi:AcrR family transcriptional regulator
MARIANSEGRPYSSQLREQQAQETRARILDATLKVMAGGVASISIPGVAREAGVSVPTVYRHFGTKQALLAAVYPYLADRAGLGQLPVPESVGEFREMVHTVFSRLHSLGGEVRVAMAMPASEEARRIQMPSRYATSRRFAARVMPTAAKVEQDRLARVLIVLASSSAMVLWLDHLGSSVDEAADDIDWVLRTCIAAAPKGKTPKGKKR